MRRWRLSSTVEEDVPQDVVDVSERLAPYGHSELRPRWRADLIAADAKRRARRVQTDAWGNRARLG
jgi:hypothetical protein